MLPGVEYLPPLSVVYVLSSFPFFLLSEVVDIKTPGIQRKEDSIRAEEFEGKTLFQLEQGLGVSSFSPSDCQ